MTMIVRLVERTAAVSLVGDIVPDGASASNEGLSRDGAEMGTVPDSDSGVCNSRPVVVAILRDDWRIKCSGEI